MKIVVNTRLLIKNKLEGIGWFTYETLKRITTSHPKIKFYFLFDRQFDKSFVFSKNVIPIVLKPQARHPILFKIWFNWSVYVFLKKIKADLFLSPDGYLSLTTKVPQISVMHDLNFEHHPEYLPKHITAYYKKYFPLFAKKATRIITVSQFSKNDIINKYKIDKQKIDVVHNGVNNMFGPIGNNEQNNVRLKHTNGNHFFIYIGSLNPRKNIQNTLKSFDLFKTKTKSDYKFIIVGEKLWKEKAIEKCYKNLKHKEDIIFKGRLYNKDLKDLLASATALLYVSFFEGFGIPVVEAMKCGTPVITSTKSSLPEIAGSSAILCNPNDINNIAKQMEKITETKTREYYIQKGFVNAEKYNWDNTAKGVWKSIDKVLNQKS